MYTPLLLISSLALASASSSSSSSTPQDTPQDPPPIGALWTASWTASDLAQHKTSCHAKTSYSAEMYTLAEMYPALEDYAGRLKMFYSGQHYPGTWSGADPHGPHRTLLKMPLSSLPPKMHAYLATNSTQRHYSVMDDVVFFAPGAVYPLVPLWVDEVDGKEGGERGCEGVFGSLDGYTSVIGEGGTVGKVGYEVEEEKEGKENGVRFWVEGWRVEGEKENVKEGREEL